MLPETYWAPPSFCRGGGGGIEPPTKFSKRGGGLDRTSTFKGGLLGKTGLTLFKEGCNFHKKKKLKSETFNDKKSL